MATKKLKVNVIAGRNLAPKNGNISDPYCEVALLDEQGNKIGKSITTKVIKGTLTPQWIQVLEFSVGANFAGLKLRVWDKHKFRSDKFMGQVTIKLNTALLSSKESLDDWFPLSKRATKEYVSGDVHLHIHYGDKTSSPDSKRERDRSSTLTPEMSSIDVKVSAHFNTDEINKKLQNSTHIVVDEIEEEEEGEKEKEKEKEKEGDYEKIRDGPSATALEKLTKEDKELTFTNKNLEVTNNSANYVLQYAKGNVKVNGGKWYFETKLQTSGQILIGWCTTNFNPKNNTGDSWCYDGSSQRKARKGEGNDRYGEYWGNGDIIGCSLDLDNQSIQFSRNGKDLGVAYTDLRVQGGRLCPVFGLARKTKIQCNFGKEPFISSPNGFNPLHMILSDKEFEQLVKLFNKYKEIGNEKKVDSKSETEPKDSIHGPGMLEFQRDLGSSDEEDPILLIIAWKLQAEAVWEISREEFMNAFSITGCFTIEKIKNKIKEWRSELHENQHFKQFYNFAFDYLKEEKKMLLTEEAIMVWKIILRDEHAWPLLQDFGVYLQESEKKAISKDVWQQLYHFMRAHPKDLKEYDPNSSWPIVYDEFVEWMESKGKK